MTASRRMARGTPRRQTNLRLDAHKLERLREESDRRGFSMSRIVDDALDLWFDLYGHTDVR